MCEQNASYLWKYSESGSKSLNKICVKIIQKVLKQPLQHANFQKLSRGARPQPLWSPSSFSISFKLVLQKICTLEKNGEICPPPVFLNFSLCHCADVMTYSAVHLNLSGKLYICGRAALGFKMFSNAVLRVKIIAHPWLKYK